MPFGKRGGGGRRVAPRLPVELPAVLMALASSGTAIIADLSLTGAKLRGCDLPRAGHDIWLKVDAVNVLATVVWSHDGHCGITFDTPLNVLELHQLHSQGSRARFLRITPEEQQAAEDWCNGLAR